ncbi:MAG: hypothetical protein L5655_09745 [Thermosediminibacteraceae bacterium]|nr:hypothetical protein [Thermosediminibacteraceae bacterium]
MLIETTINAQTKNYLKEHKLAELIKKIEFDREYIVQIFNFFTDVAPQDIYRFMITYGIIEENLEAFYKKYVKPYYPNKHLEEMFENA